MHIITQAEYDSYNGTLEGRILAFQNALEAHRFTVDQPAPVETDLIEYIVRAAGGQFSIAPPDPELPDPATAPAAGVVAAMAALRIEGDVIFGVEQALGVAFALAMDVGDYWIFFQEPMLGASYLPFVLAPGFNADPMECEEDFLRIVVTDRASGLPATPGRLLLSVQRT